MVRRIDINVRGLAVWLAAVGSAGFALPAASQLLDGTIEDVVGREVAEQVEQDVAERLENAVEEEIESQVTQQVEAGVEGAVEQQIESEVVDAVQAQVESGVVDAVQEQVESGVVSAVQQQIETGVVSTIATQIEASIPGEIDAQLLDEVEGELGDIAGELDERVPGGVGSGAEIGPGASVDDDADGGGTEESADDAQPERFAADVDVAGRSIERDVWVILVPAEHAARIPTWGFTIRERRDLATLDRVLLRVAAPEDREIAQAALDLALDAPGTEVDFNHVYRPGTDDDVESTLSGVPARDRGVAVQPPAAALAIGIVDTAVAREHEALRAADIVQRDFVPFEAERPTAHGTAVASVLVGEGANLRPQLRGGRVYAASVFFSDADGNDASTAASLAAAGEWLAAQGVRVVNMSLAGPPNRVLGAAIAALVERGVIVVAAVGNNGPHGEPLYPAAYPNVVAVTAVDAANRIYRYANRGPHVMFAALGVDVAVARSTGGYGEQSGTSIAAPHAAAVIARAVFGRPAASRAAVLAELKSAARDLGAKDFDTLFGFGLVEPLDDAPVTASR